MCFHHDVTLICAECPTICGLDLDLDGASDLNKKSSEFGSKKPLSRLCVTKPLVRDLLQTILEAS